MICLPDKVTKALPLGVFFASVSLSFTSCFLHSNTAFAQNIPSFSYCEKDIHEDADYWDYTVRHPAEKLDGVRYPDKRPQEETLQGSGVLKANAFCENAKILNKCFAKGVAKYSNIAPDLVKWARVKNIDLKRLLMAVAAQETQLGAVPDVVNERGTFYGIGMMQTISTGWKWNDDRWLGLQANTLTQIEWGLRLLNEKSKNLTAQDGIYELAWYYNSNATQSIRSTYARKVTNFYNNTLSADACAIPNIDSSVPISFNPTGDNSARETQIESSKVNEGFIDNGVLFAFRPEFSNISVKVQKMDRNGWLTLQTALGGDDKYCYTFNQTGRRQLLIEGKKDGASFYQILNLNVTNKNGGISECKTESGGVVISGVPNETPSPSTERDLISSIVPGGVYGNGVQLWFANDLTDFSVTVLNENKRFLIASHLRGTDVLCYREKTSSQAQSAIFEIEGIDSTGRVKRQYPVTLSAAQTDSPRCPTDAGIRVTSALSDPETPQEILVDSVSHQQRVNNGVIFTFTRDVTNISIVSPFKGKDYELASNLDSSNGLCVTFTHPGQRDFVISGVRNGRSVTQKLTLNIDASPSNDGRCPSQPGGLVFSASEAAPVRPSTPTPPDTDWPPPVQPRDTDWPYIVISPTPGSTLANGLPLQFNEQVRNIRVSVDNGGSQVPLLQDPLDGSRQGLCYRFTNPGIKKLHVTGVRNGQEVSMDLGYEITNAQSNTNWCPPEDQNGGKIFDPHVAQVTMPTQQDSHQKVVQDILNEALKYQNQYFREGVSAQCAEFVRAVLAKGCAPRFASNHARVIQANHPYDERYLNPSDGLSPTYANSLAGDEVGRRVNSFNELQPGDLVFLKNTYGNWRDGVITHVGIYVGNGNYIDRPTMSAPVRVRPVNTSNFAAGTRVYDSWCTSAVKIYD